MVKIAFLESFIKKNSKTELSAQGLIWFYGISTIIGYLMPHPLYTFILNI